jgi:hypothetical protein
MQIAGDASDLPDIAVCVTGRHNRKMHIAGDANDLPDIAVCLNGRGNGSGYEPACNASSTTSTQCRTGMPVPDCRW